MVCEELTFSIRESRSLANTMRGSMPGWIGREHVGAPVARQPNQNDIVVVIEVTAAEINPMVVSHDHGDWKHLVRVLKAATCPCCGSRRVPPSSGPMSRRQNDRNGSGKTP